jgi:hypothetical protein
MHTCAESFNYIAKASRSTFEAMQQHGSFVSDLPPLSSTGGGGMSKPIRLDRVGLGALPWPHKVLLTLNERAQRQNFYFYFQCMGDALTPPLESQLSDS